MQAIRAVGREAAAKKYDILSAMLAHALEGDKHRQRLVLRLLSLVTSRYNWQQDELTIGQREIGRLWCVDERTVKREMARLRALGWIIVKQPGVRGRVSVLGIDFDRIMLDTRTAWANIGQDFVERFEARGGREAPQETTVVPFRRPGASVENGIWAVACKSLADEDAPLFDAWFAGLIEAEREGGCLILTAPTRFHATYVQTHLLDRVRIALSRADASIQRVRIISR